MGQHLVFTNSSGRGPSYLSESRSSSDKIGAEALDAQIRTLASNPPPGRDDEDLNRLMDEVETEIDNAIFETRVALLGIERVIENRL